MSWTSERIKQLRKRYGETQEEFCKRFRVTIDAIQCWEQGRGDPSGPVEVILNQLEEEIEKRQLA